MERPGETRRDHEGPWLDLGAVQCRWLLVEHHPSGTECEIQEMKSCPAAREAKAKMGPESLIAAGGVNIYGRVREVRSI